MAAIVVLAAGLWGAPVHPAGASTTPIRVQALQWAESQAGKWYCYGGAGPGCYDCSGLVMAAFAHAGISLPHSTFSMLADSRLVRIPLADAQRGDLMFYGSGHVELKTRNGTFGALETGTRLGWHRPSAYWHPTMAMRLR